MSYDNLETLNDRHYLVAWLKAAGCKNTDIAAKLGLTPQTVSAMLHSELLRLKVEEFRQVMLDRSTNKLAEELNRLSPKALHAIETLMESAESESVRLNAANSVLDRAPNVPRKHALDTQSNTLVLGDRNLYQIISIAMETKDEEAIERLRDLQLAHTDLPPIDAVVGELRQMDDMEADPVRE